MKRVADRYFRINEPAGASSGDLFPTDQGQPSEKTSVGTENRYPTVREDKYDNRDNLTATYWG